MEVEKKSLISFKRSKSPMRPNRSPRSHSSSESTKVNESQRKSKKVHEVTGVKIFDLQVSLRIDTPSILHSLFVVCQRGRDEMRHKRQRFRKK